MIRGLAIETSSRIGSVALVEDGSVAADDTFPHGLQHAARIIPAIESLCQKLGWKSSDIRQIYVSAGPGSFTGLRIGITLAKTLAFASGAQLVAVPTVNVLAENVPQDAEHAIIVIDAKRGQIFTAAFDREGSVWKTREPAHLDSLAAMLQKSPRPVHLIGEGIPYHRQAIPDEGGAIQIVDDLLWRPQASVVARLGWQMAARGEFTKPLDLLPIYIRRPEAEEKFQAKSTPS
jgi:tRNA threonylcarbamoyladenosine biosynthesis protein TsaB